MGETRDEETAEIVVRASLTGHLVFSTLHTNDAASALIRLVDMGVEPYLAASATRACMAQRLLRKLCPTCRVRSGDDTAVKRRLEQAGKPMDQWFSPGTCEQCREGYRGRTGIFELFRMQAEIEDALRKGSGLAEIRRLMTLSGSRTLLQDGLLKVERGETSPEELFRAVSAVL